MSKEKLESEGSGSAEQSQGVPQPGNKLAVQGTGSPVTGQRQALLGIQRKLTPKELKEPGAAKLILEILQASDSECMRLKPFENDFHSMDKRAAILTEKLDSIKSIDVFHTVNVGLGGILIGFIPFFNQLGLIYAVVTGLVGVALIGYSVIIRVGKK